MHGYLLLTASSICCTFSSDKLSKWILKSDTFYPRKFLLLVISAAYMVDVKVWHGSSNSIFTTCNDATGGKNHEK